MIANRSAWPQVRRWESEQLHKLAKRLRRLSWEAELSAGQEQLWRQLVAELVWRSARPRRGHRRCWCELCAVDVDAELGGAGHGVDAEPNGTTSR